MTLHRARACLALVAVCVLGLVAGTGLGSPAAATTSTLSDHVDDTYQTNGRVDAILTVGDIVYIGGNFTSVRPPGAAAGTQEVPRARLAAFQISSGALLPWNPGANRAVYALAASADGQTVYVGGNFSKIGAVNRKHMAAVDAFSGGVTPFRADTDYDVQAIATSDCLGCTPESRVYLGGNFTTVNGVPRSRVAAVDPTTGSLIDTWAPSVDNEVRAITLSLDGTSVYLGGEFTSINQNTGQKRLAKLSALDATFQPWRTRPGYPVYQIIVTTSAVYLGGNGSGGHAGLYSTDGDRGWVTQTDGGVQALALLDGVLYVGGHFDNVCVGDTAGATVGFHCPTNAASRHKLLAVDPSNGSLDPWNPGANSNLGVWSLGASSGRLHVGGDFTRIGHFHAQQGYGQFSEQ